MAAAKREDVSPGMPPTGVTVARARAREVDALVQEIVRAMVDGTWASGELAAELADREGVSPDTVDEWASDAGRVLRIAPDVEEYRGKNLRRLDELATAGEGKVRVAAIGEQNKMLGLHAPVKVKVEATVEAMAQLSTREQLAKARELYAALPEMIAALERQLAEENAITVPALPESTTEEGSC